MIKMNDKINKKLDEIIKLRLIPFAEEFAAEKCLRKPWADLSDVVNRHKKKIKSDICKWIKEKAVIDRQVFRSVVCEHWPSICEDSGEPGWSQEELDGCYDDLISMMLL